MVLDRLSRGIRQAGLMGRCRVHLTGASGAGVTTLGRALSGHLAIPHHDTDDYFWLPSNPPYCEKRPVADRLRLMREMFLPRSNWVLSGSLDSWGNSIVGNFDLVVFVKVPTKIRLMRLRNRETHRYGTEAVSPEGWRFEETEKFIDWASQYDNGHFNGRNVTRHKDWLEKLKCPVLNVDGTIAESELLQNIIAKLA